MTGISAVAPSAAEAGLATPTVREDLKMLAYWISLGAAAGGLGGVVVGGIGGRLAMFLLRFTSDESVRGLESDDGFIIGRFNFLDTLNLLATTAFLGVLVGLIVVFGRPFLPKRGMPFAWAVAGATIGAQVLLAAMGLISLDLVRIGLRFPCSLPFRPSERALSRGSSISTRGSGRKTESGQASRPWPHFP